MLFSTVDYFPVVLNKVVVPEAADLRKSIEVLVDCSRRARAERSYCANILLESPAGDPGLDAAGRRTFAALIKQADPVMIERTIISVVIVSSPMRRGALTALLWMVGSQPPTIVRATIQDALDIVRATLGKKDVRFPDTLTLEAALRFDRASR